MGSKTKTLRQMVWAKAVADGTCEIEVESQKVADRMRFQLYDARKELSEFSQERKDADACMVTVFPTPEMKWVVRVQALDAQAEARAMARALGIALESIGHSETEEEKEARESAARIMARLAGGDS